MSEDHKKEIDQISGVETTGHEWDGLKELNNPAPRWWLIVWIVCTIWAVGYWFVYPAWPTAWPGFGSGEEAEKTGSVTRVTTGATQGSAGWTEYKQLEESQAQIVARQAGYLEKFQGASYEQIANDPELYKFAVAGGNALFKNNCSVCHGADAQGSKGFPNLSDDDWLWGGDLASIEQTVRFGIRSEHDETRQSAMPSFGKDELLEKEEVDQVVDYVLSMSSEEGPKADAPGAEIFANNCASCHGEQGKGGRDFGAPNLTDQIWLYGGEKEDVYNTVFNAHAGVMPFWEGKLDENAIRQLTIYVHGLGGGEGVGAAVEASAEESAPTPEAAQPAEGEGASTEEPAPAEAESDGSAAE